MSDKPLPALRLLRIFALVTAATVVLVFLELSTWVVHNQSEVFVFRAIRIAFELLLAVFLCFTIYRKEQYFRSSLLGETKERDLANERTRLATEAAGIGYWDWDILSDKQVWSDTCKALLQLPHESDTNFEALMSRVHPDDRESVWRAINHAVEHKEQYDCEFRVVWPDTSIHWRVAKGRVFYDDTKRPIRMIGVFIDIEDQKATEERLHLQAAALEAAANAIAITDSEGSIVWVNRAFTELTQYSREESVGQNHRMLKSGEQNRSFYQNLWATIKAGRVWQGEIRNRKKDGSLYTEEQTITPVRSPSGEITNFIAIKQDATAKKHLEAQYRQAQKMEAVGRLAGGVAHDFNNILSVIIGYCDMAQDDLQPQQPAAKSLQHIRMAADRAASLTKQLLAFSRQQIVYPRIVDLNAVVENMLDLLQRLVGDDVTISTERTPALGSIKADVGQIEHVLMNLAANARDAMPGGGRITIETRNVELDDSYQREHEPVQTGQYVMLSVSDSGCGMDEATKARIFEPFFTTKELGKGSGLGLSTVYGIIKQSGGFIWVYSEPAKGTIFKVYFPRVAGIAEAILRPTDQRPARGGTETILLVEDNDALRELVARTLQKAGYTVLQSGSSETALELAATRKERIDLLLADIVMPQISGVQLVNRMRESAPELKALLMSGYSPLNLSQLTAIPAGVTFIEKPFTRSSLLSNIRTALRESAEN